MTYNKISAALIISCSFAFTLASNQTFGASLGGYYYGSANSGPDVVIKEQKIYDDHYTCTLDMPWDWVHRCPSPSERPPTPVVAVPSVPGCAAQRVTVPMGDGKEQTVIINRC
jgi:hypothetical protein